MAVSKTRRAVGAGVAFIGVGAAGLLMAAPANAAVTGVEITSPSGYALSSGSYGAGCGYTVEATVNDNNPGAPVQFELFEVVGGSTNAVEDLGTETATQNVASVDWTPGATGAYQIGARQQLTPAVEDDPMTPGDESAPATWTAYVMSDTYNVTGTGIQVPAATLGSVDFDLPFADSCVVLPF
ncbi:hypothetical protein V1Y59_22570 [Gordonia sp. PKS22-38]|uniref:Secreted protein n=1 Tax=Gordonia prachuapensis TaxID=3115651 RepID=A0ABU7N006_9ACTN|nr:hypothetical protein [Gordonia sp. PKS22-38]